MIVLTQEQIQCFIENGDQIEKRIQEFEKMEGISGIHGLRSMNWVNVRGSTYFSIPQFRYYQKNKHLFQSPLYEALR